MSESCPTYESVMSHTNESWSVSHVDRGHVEGVNIVAIVVNVVDNVVAGKILCVNVVCVVVCSCCCVLCLLLCERVYASVTMDVKVCARAPL